MTETMIEVSRLKKRYGNFEAVKDISFSVESGEVVGFLGPNGAGKSTTLRILACFLGPTSGLVRVAGHDVVEKPMQARTSIGYMPETAPLYPEMRVSEYLRFRAELKGVARGDRAKRMGAALEDAGLRDMEQVLIGQLSKGYRQRVGLADALVAAPPLLILDEPTAGLDPNQIREVRSLIGRLSERHTILVSTHILSEVEAMCTRGIVIAQGELVAEGTIAELRSLRKARAVRIRLRGNQELALTTVRAIAGVASAKSDDEQPEGELTLQAEYADIDHGDDTTAQIVAALVAEELDVLEVAPQGSLEQVFAELTQPARMR